MRACVRAGLVHVYIVADWTDWTDWTDGRTDGRTWYLVEWRISLPFLASSTAFYTLAQNKGVVLRVKRTGLSSVVADKWYSKSVR